MNKESMFQVEFDYLNGISALLIWSIPAAGFEPATRKKWEKVNRIVV